MEKLYTVEEVCELWSVTPLFVRDHVAYAGRTPKRQPALQAIMLSGNRRLRFTQSALDDFFAAIAANNEQKAKAA